MQYRRDAGSTVAIDRLPVFGFSVDDSNRQVAFLSSLSFTRPLFHEFNAKFGLTRTNEDEGYRSRPDRPTTDEVGRLSIVDVTGHWTGVGWTVT